ncbi:MAG: sugar phosphate isomerase/epimerase family protein [Limnochordia bacterium]
MLIPGIWTAMYVEQSLDAAIRSLHALGWEAFECSSEHVEMIDKDDEPSKRIAETRQALNELGCAMPQAHALLHADVAHPDPQRRQEFMDTLGRHLKICAALGVRTAVIHPGNGAGIYKTPEERRTLIALNIENFRRLGDQAGELGLKIGIENMPVSPKDANRFGVHPNELLVELLARVDHPALGITIDTDHTQTSGLDTAEVIRQFGKHIIGTHISDADRRGLSHRTPGNATIDWVSVMKAFRDIQYSGIFNLEIPGERHREPDIVKMKVRHAREVTEWLVNQVNNPESE